MDTITLQEVGEPVLENDEHGEIPRQDHHSHEREERRYSAEAILDVLDPYAAIIDGVRLPAPQS